MLLDSWRLAVGTLTALPVRPPATVDRRRAGLAMVLAPVAVAPLGLLLAGTALVGQGLGLAGLVVAVLAVATVVLGNRAFHLDGLSDTVDGLAASYDRERSLAVMRSGVAGPAGVVAVLLVLLLQVGGLGSVLSGPHEVRSAVLAGLALCASRVALALCCTRGVPAARADGLGHTYTQTVARPVAVAVLLVAAALLALAGAWAGLDWWRGALAVALAAVVVGLVVHRAVRRLGGVTGDVLGASTEVAFAVLLVALS